MQRCVEGVVISELDFRETSKIINVMTKEFGKIGIIAKGAKQIKSKLRTGTMAITHGFFHVYYKENKLSILKEVEVINDFLNIKSDLSKLGAATYIIDVFNQVTKNEFNEAWYNDFLATLEKIDEGYDAKIITNIFSLKVMGMLGIMPELNSCITCGDKANIVTFSIAKGGFVCEDCCMGDQVFSDKTIKLLRMLSYVDIAKITKLDIKRETAKEIDLIINQYFEEYSGLYLNNKKIMEKLNA